MINQPWKNRNWFTFTVISVPTSEAKVYYPTTKKQTINLSDVQGWEIVPSNGSRRKYGPPAPDVCRVTLSSGINMRLFAGEVRTSSRTANTGTIEIDQITDFFDAMRSAKLLS